MFLFKILIKAFNMLGNGLAMLIGPALVKINSTDHKHRSGTYIGAYFEISPKSDSAYYEFTYIILFLPFSKIIYLFVYTLSFSNVLQIIQINENISYICTCNTLAMIIINNRLGLRLSSRLNRFLFWHFIF